MRVPLRVRLAERGATLIEAALATGVLAVAIPLVCAAMAEAGKCVDAARAETRSAWISAACMEEVRAIRNGSSRYFDKVPAGNPFPGEGVLLALGFSNEGKPVGGISRHQYDLGVRQSDDPRARYIATIKATSQGAEDNHQLLKLRVTIEYPAGAPAGKRRKIDFHSRIP